VWLWPCVLCLVSCGVLSPPVLALTSLLQDDDEWDDYRENKKDFTGLKIEKLTVKQPEKEEEDETEVRCRAQQPHVIDSG
jgi:hypothetical protein